MRIDSPKVSTPKPPRRLAWYMAASALASRAWASVGAEGVQRHADRGVEEHLGVVHGDRAGTVLRHPVDEGHGLPLGPAGASDEGEELVAAEPGHELGLAVGHLRSRRGHRHQHLVTHRRGRSSR